MADNFKDNLSARSIITQAIKRSNKNKYNVAMHMQTEELTGEPNDRTSYDVGEEPEYKNLDY